MFTTLLFRASTISTRLCRGALIVIVALMAFNSPVYAENALEETAPAKELQKVKVNSADAETLAKALTGVGLKKAQAIIEYRNKNGRFKSVEDLTAVKGIGESILKQNASKIIL